MKKNYGENVIPNFFIGHIASRPSVHDLQ